MYYPTYDEVDAAILRLWNRNKKGATTLEVIRELKKNPKYTTGWMAKTVQNMKNWKIKE